MRDACVCGRKYAAPQLKQHQQSCPEYAHKLQSLLDRRSRSSSKNALSSGAARSSTRTPGTRRVASRALPWEPSSAPAPIVGSEDDSTRDLLPIGTLDGVEHAIDLDVPAQATVPELPSVRRRTHHRVPRKFRDLVPEPLAPAQPAPSGIRRVLLRVSQPFTTAVNAFGLFRIFRRQPESDPKPQPSVEQTSPSKPPFSSGWAPYPNRSVALFNHWFWNDGMANKSRESRASLLDVILDPAFSLDDLRGINWANLDREVAGDLGSFGDGWVSETLTVNIPGGRGTSARAADVAGFQHRPIIPLLRHIISTEPAVETSWTWTPATLMHRAPDRTKSRVAGEVYNSPRAQRLYDEVQRLPREAGDTMDRRVVYLMPGSDSTHLAQFGNASEWPAFIGIGNQSKYVRTQRSAHAMHHFASFPKIPDSLHDEINSMGLKKSAKKQVLTHCRRELMQAAWAKILSPEFIHAYKYGFEQLCQDGIVRRFFPRFFTYTADYPEKVLIATLRDNGDCPCTKCTVKKSDIHQLGTIVDTITRVQSMRQHNGVWTRTVSQVSEWVRKGVCGLSSVLADSKLKVYSWVAVVNAFSVLREIDPEFSIFKLFAPDLLHEFEIGVWKAVLTHLLRILQASGSDLLGELDRRFRLTPVFGRFSIRRFANNVSELKQLAAHNFEDILQCAIPVFEGLLPEPYNTTVLELLYTLAEWHAFAKSRIHTTVSLKDFEVVTTQLGDQLRRFAADVCPQFKTTELPREKEARARREARKNPAQQAQVAPRPDGPKAKTLNLNTYKVHSLGYYPSFIRECGTTESYSTLLVENSHPELKARYKRTNKRNASRQMGEIERIQSNTRHIIRTMEAKRLSASERGIDEDAILPTSQERLSISKRQRPCDAYDIGDWCREHAAKPEDFDDRLRDHLLNRLRLPEYDGDETTYDTDARLQLDIDQNRMYPHKTMGISYTTYDVRRGEDTIHIGTDRVDIMLRSCEDGPAAHPYWYARVLGLYHVNVCDLGPRSTTKTLKPLYFLHVRWFARAEDDVTGTPRRLSRVGWDKENEFGFVNPELVLRACHIAPAFAHGEAPQSTRLQRQVTPEYNWYYVMRWSDRDLFHRFRGGAIGHAERRNGNEGLSMDPQGDEDMESDSDEQETAQLGDDDDSSSEGGDEDEDEDEGDDDDDMDVDDEPAAANDEAELTDASDADSQNLAMTDDEKDLDFFD